MSYINTVLLICIIISPITLLYHYIFFKHSLCIAIHLSIFLLYHYILINTKCHITDSCIIISPLFIIYSSLLSDHNNTDLRICIIISPLSLYIN